MEFLYEALVLGYLTNGGNRFCCPQYCIKSAGEKSDWRCPDFLVLDFDTSRVIVAEVTTAWNIKPLTAKTIELHDQGIPRIKEQLKTESFAKIVDWPIRLQLFVREDRKADMQKALAAHIDESNFEVIALEHVCQRWKWTN